MSKTPEQESFLEDCFADLDEFLQRNEWGQARALIDSVREQGYDAAPFQGAYNRTWFVNNIMHTPGITFRGV